MDRNSAKSSEPDMLYQLLSMQDSFGQELNEADLLFSCRQAGPS